MEGSTEKTKKIEVRISADGMQAFVKLSRPGKDAERGTYTVQEVMEALGAHHVTYGIDQEKILQTVNEEIYGREVEAAKGIPVQNGLPGEYEFLFQRNLSRQPKELPDGSVDYLSIKTVETVSEGDTVAIYHPAIPGKDGMTVTGKKVPARNARDLPPLGGKHVLRSEDGLTYTAEISGKIEMNGNNRIMISPVYEVREKVGTEIGNIDFAGDVVIHEGVTNGVTIRARGNVTIMGLVENCTIDAEGDVYLLKGVKGNGQTRITAGGNITAQFIEYAYVKAKGDITADVFFKSEVISDGVITLSGKFSSVVGGSMSAVEGVECYSIGNEFGVPTEVGAGVSPDRQSEALVSQKKIEAIQDRLEKIRVGIERFDSLGKAKGIDVQKDPRRVKLLRAKIQESAVMQEEELKYMDLKKILERGGHAVIRIHKDVFPGVILEIGDKKLNVPDRQNNVECRRTDRGIRMESMEGI